MKVEKINVLEDHDMAVKYEVTAVPTLVFVDQSGEALAKHVGYLDEDSLIKAWADLGVELKPAK